MIRALARSAARALPPQVKARLARWRFGHGDTGPRFRVGRDRDGAVVRFTIDDRLRILASGDAADAVQYHFEQDGDSRGEMDAFLSVSSGAPSDALLLDVGAHIGLFTVVHLAMAPTHRAILFEPSRPLVSAAEAWLGLNEMTDRSDLRCAGVGGTVGSRAIETDALGFAQEARRPSSGTLVPFTTIDHVCGTEGLRPAIIKIDVEGHEVEVIEGARDTLRRVRPILCLELHLDMLERAGTPLEPLLRTLEAADYRLTSTDGRPLSAAQVRHSLKAIVRVTAFPRERS